jgi:membrane peptidoglycan carboxypeptidase
MSLCLGPCEITVSEMVSGYSAFVNHGIRTLPLYVTKIEDNEGNVVARFQPRMNEVISEESAHKMIYMLKGVVDGGTAGRLRYKYNLTNELAGSGLTGNDEFINPLFECDNFIISPHLGAQSVDASRDIGNYIVEKIKEVCHLG